MQDTHTMSAHLMPAYVADPSPVVRLPVGRHFGSVTGVQVTGDGHIWVLHIAANMAWGPPGSCDDPAARLPPVCEFDADGNFLQGWGGAGWLPPVDGRAQWPRQEETIAFDDEHTVWVFGADVAYDHAVQRFTRDGRLLLRIGKFGDTGGDGSGTLLGCPTDCWHDVARREVYVTDGYLNHRVAVFNSDTGAFLRCFGGDGGVPRDGAADPAAGFNNPVHAITRGPDGLLYVSDRKNDRVRVYDAVGQSQARHVRDIAVVQQSPFGTCFNVAFTPDGQFLVINDGSNSRLWAMDTTRWEIAGHLRAANSDGADLSATVHKICTDRDGNLLLARTARGIERLLWQGSDA